MTYAIVAVDDKNGIATEDGIPWDLPLDRRYFKNKTIGQSVLMGAKTYSELSVPLPSRTNYVATRKQSIRPGFYPVTDAARFVKDFPEDIWVIGGTEIYTATWAYIQKIYLTRIMANFSCTKFFPSFEEIFTPTSKSKLHKDNGLNLRFETWERKTL